MQDNSPQPSPDESPASACEVQASHDCTVVAPAWEEYLHRREDATIYHDPRWGRVMQRAYGNLPFYLTASRRQRVVGILQLVAQKSLLFGSHMCSLPYFDAAGILADDEAARDALLRQVRQMMSVCRSDWAELRQLGQMGSSLPVRTDKVTMWLDLPAGADAMWNALKTKVRTKVRKAQKADLSVQHGAGELLGDFVAVYARTMRDLGSPPHSAGFFRRILEAFGQAVRIFVVRSGRAPLAAAFTLTDRGAFRVPWSGSDRRFRRLGANRLLYWTMLAHAAEAGAPRFDFGRSTRGSGTYQFKREWGAQEVPLYWHYLLPEGRELPQLRPDSRKYRLLVSCWKRLPVALARLLGPRLIRKLT